MPDAKKEETPPSITEILNNARKSAIRGGTAGAAAMGANVACLMWLRTTVNYQYRNGTSFPVALKTLYADGGVPRFYRGLLPALFQGPLSRFGRSGSVVIRMSKKSSRSTQTCLYPFYRRYRREYWYLDAVGSTGIHQGNECWLKDCLCIRSCSRFPYFHHAY